MKKEQLNENQPFRETAVMRWFTNTQIEDLPNEIWVDMFGFDGYYLVSNLGRVKSLSRPCATAKGTFYMSKEIIRKQSLHHNRLHVNISCNGQLYSLNLSAVIYYSFFPEKHTDNKKYCVMHKDKIQYNNVIENLILEKVSDSHKLNFAKQLLPHLAENNRKKQEKNALRTHKTCSKCNLLKEVIEFFHGNTCNVCRALYKKELYLKNKVSQTSA